MGTDTSVSVRYWIPTDSRADFDDVQGIDDFRKDLAADYVAVVKGRPAGAGGWVHLLVEIISSLPLSHIAQLLIDGMAYDLIKEGSKSFVLRPFLAAYRKLKARNQERHVDIGELRIEFQDCRVVIHNISNDTIADNLGIILQTLAQHYNRLTLRSGERPFAIQIPVFEDLDEEASSKFRVIGEIDETIMSNGPGDYLAYWGLVYDRASVVRVYDVAKELMLEEAFSTIEEYWRELSQRAGVKMNASTQE